MTARIERVATVLAAADAEARAMGLPDGFMQMAQALDDAGLLMPEALPDARLAENEAVEAATPLGPITSYSVKQGINGAWHVRYRQDGQRKGKRNFATEAQALAWIGKKIEKFGGPS